MLKGRQILFMIVTFFKTNRQMELFYSIEDLSTLPWLGDRELHKFRHKWNEVTGSLSDHLSHDTLANVLAKKLDQSHELKGDMEYYWRMPNGHADHTYEFLRASIDRNLARRQEKKNRDEQSRSLKTNDHGHATATLAKKVSSAASGAGNRTTSAPGGAIEAASAVNGAEKGKGKGGGKAPKPGQSCHKYAKPGKCPREETIGVGKCLFPNRIQDRLTLTRLPPRRVDLPAPPAGSTTGTKAPAQPGACPNRKSPNAEH